MKKSDFPVAFPWANMAYESTMLALEAQQVIAMRLTKMAMGGPDVQKEAELMVSEKLETMAESGRLMMAAALDGKSDMDAAKVMKLYRKKVTANRRRLST